MNSSGKDKYTQVRDTVTTKVSQLCHRKCPVKNFEIYKLNPNLEISIIVAN